MKLRLNRNSIRLRLGKSEVESLLRDGRVSEKVDFGPDNSPNLVYELHTADIPQFSAVFDEGRISIGVPRMTAAEWASGDDLSLRGSQKIEGGSELSILIEKDLACRTRDRDVDNADTFPNPPNQPDC